MLSEAGYDVNGYLEEEKFLYSNQDYLLTKFWFIPERQLVFKFDGEPTVGWEWWFDPQAPGSLVCHEFRNMNLNHQTYCLSYSSNSWEDVWPFNYPEWSECYEPFYSTSSMEVDRWQKLKSNAACRHARQAPKKYPEFFRELNEEPAIPGAWVEDLRD